MSGPLIYLVAGEPSGDRLGSALMRALRAQAPGVCFAGIGGTTMAAEGLQSRFDIAEIALMGIAEVVPRLVPVLRRIRETVADVVAEAPAALVTIDSPGFGLRVARGVRARAPGIRTIHYVAPTVWAWRPGRARAMARYVDHVLALFPFEPPYMTAAGMGCDFVGHPVAERPQPGLEAIAAFRARAGAGPLLLMAPGSRASEIARMMPIFSQVVARLATAQPGLRLAIPVAETVARAVVQAAAQLAVPPVLVMPDEGEAAKRAAFAAADAALATSGTVTLELAAAGTPMVSAYRTSRATAAIVRRLLRVDTANLVNLIGGEKVVLEFLQEACTAEAITPEVAGLLAGPQAGAAQRAAFGRVMAALGRGGEAPSARAASAVLRVLGAPGAAASSQPRGAGV